MGKKEKGIGHAAVGELKRYDAIIITGGSSGIGEAFLRDAAESSDAPIFNLSRSFPKLARQFGNISHVECDLADADSLARAVAVVSEKLAQLGEKLGRAPKVLLINNAGFGLYGTFPEPSVGRNDDMIRLNVGALTRLCGEFLPAVKAGRGSIINISSVAAFEPCPVLGVYAATKAYVKSFSLMLSYELSKSGCKCLCVCPGPTSSNFFRAAGFSEPPLAGGYGHEPRDVSAAAYRALAKGKNIVVVGFWNGVMAAATRFVPTGLLLKISGMVLERVRRK